MQPTEHLHVVLHITSVFNRFNFSLVYCLCGERKVHLQQISCQGILHLFEFLANDQFDVVFYLYISLPVSLLSNFNGYISFLTVFDDKNWKTTSDWLCPWTLRMHSWLLICYPASSDAPEAQLWSAGLSLFAGRHHCTLTKPEQQA